MRALFFVLMTVPGLMVFAQPLPTDTTNPFAVELRAVARAYPDSVVLRWGISRPGAWVEYNAVGWVVERKRIDAPSTAAPWQSLAATPIKPWTLQEWMQRTTPSNTWAGVAAQCLYGTLAIPTPSGVDALRLASSDLTNRHGFAHLVADFDAVTATGLALRFVDRNVEQGASYAYRVAPARQDSVFVVDTAYAFATPGQEYYPPTPIELAAQETEGRIVLTWTMPPTASASGFYVDRTGPDGTKRMTTTPVVPMGTRDVGIGSSMSFTDSTVGMYTPYTYAVRAIDAFAELGPPVTITAMGRDRTPPNAPRVTAPVVYGNTVAVIEWTQQDRPADLQGYRVERSLRSEGPYLPLHDGILPAFADKYADTAATTQAPWYQVVVLDTAGNESASLPAYVELIDTLPPSRPIGVIGFMDSTGRVLLTWHRGTEADLYGYRVLMANDSTHDFSQATNLILQDTVYMDSVEMRTTTPAVYYKVVAVDSRQYHSEASEICVIKRPDIIAPVSPTVRDVVVGDVAVMISFERSPSEDVQFHVLERAGTDDRWRVVDTTTAENSVFVDTTAPARMQHRYRVVAIDTSGLRSNPSTEVTARPYGRRVHSTVSTFAVELDTAAQTARLTWAYSVPPSQDFWFVILRAYDDFGFSMIGSVKSTDREYIDRSMLGSGRYRYAVQVHARTEEAPPSEAVIVLVPER
jgi:fibronectin type 3 domain-containing protein